MNVRLSTLFTFSLCSLALAAPAKKTSAPQRTAPAAAPIKKVIPFKEGLFSTETRSSGPVREAKFLYFKVDTLPEAETINFMTEECNKDLPLYETTRSHDFAQRSIIPPVKTLIQIVNDAAKELATGKVDSVTKTVKFALKDKSESVVVTFEFKKNNSKDPKTNAGMSVVITLKGTRSAIPTRTVNLLKATTLDNTFLQTWGKVLGFSSAGTLGTAAVVGALWSRRSTKPNDKPKPDFSTHFKTKEERDTAFAAHVKALKALLAKVGVSIATVESLTQKLKDADREDTKILAELPTQLAQLQAEVAELTKCFEDAKEKYASSPDSKNSHTLETPAYPTDADQNAVGTCEGSAKSALQGATQAIKAFEAEAKQAKEKEAAAIAKADAHYQSRLQQKMVVTLHEHAQNQSQKRAAQAHATQRADAHYKSKLQEKVVGALHEHAQNQGVKRAARGSATQLAERNLLRTGFRRLIQNRIKAKSDMQARVHYAQTLAGNVLTKWSERTKSQQDLRSKILKMFSNWDRRTLVSSFADWQKSTLESKAQREAQLELADNFALAIEKNLERWDYRPEIQRKDHDSAPDAHAAPKGIAYFDSYATAEEIFCSERLYWEGVYFLTPEQFEYVRTKINTPRTDNHFSKDPFEQDRYTETLAKSVFIILDPMNESEPALDGRLPEKLIWITAHKAYFQNEGSLYPVELPTESHAPAACESRVAETKEEEEYVATNLEYALTAWNTYTAKADDTNDSDDGDDDEIDEDATARGAAVVYLTSTVDSGHGAGGNGAGGHGVSTDSVPRRTLFGHDDDNLAPLIEAPEETANLKLQSIKEYLAANLTGYSSIIVSDKNINIFHKYSGLNIRVTYKFDEILLKKYSSESEAAWNNGSTEPIKIEPDASAEKTILQVCINELGLTPKEPARA